MRPLRQQLIADCTKPELSHDRSLEPYGDPIRIALHQWVRTLALHKGTALRIDGSYTRHERFAGQVLTYGHAIKPRSQYDPPHTRRAGGIHPDPRYFRN
jgi:hypothetical protein